jgi:formamidopyrimidine-DNA glycosylase
MPELPEVEHVALVLQKIVAGRKIEAAELRRERLAPDIKPRSFARKLAGTSINFIHRRGKHILFDMDNKRTLIVHLRMSGRFMLLTPDDADPKFTHAVFHFSDQNRLVFQDQRHFGLMKIVETAKLYEAKELAKLAPEPFSKEFSAQYLSERLRSSRRVLKEFLLDQTKVCGVGNIYASEALFLAGISPLKRTERVSRKSSVLLFDSIRSVLFEALEATAQIIPDPVVIGEGVYGNGSKTAWRVYDRENEPCPACSTPIRRIRQGARSTYYCPKCQR